MADVAIRAVGTPVGVDGTTMTPTIPAGTQVGDLMVVCIGSYYEFGYYWEDLTYEWTNVVAGTLGPDASCRFYLKFNEVDDGNPTFTYTGSAIEASAVMISFYNVDTSTPYDSKAGSSFSAPSSPYDVTVSFSASVDAGSMALIIWTSIDDNTWVYQSGGGTQQVSFDNTAGSDNSICVVTEAMPSGGAPGDHVARQTNKAGDAGYSLWIAIKPVSAGATPQAVAGALTFAGAMLRKAQAKRAGALTSTGAMARKTKTSKAGVLEMSGALGTLKSVTKALAGAISFAGSTVGKAKKSLSGTLTSAATLVGKAKKSLTGALTSAATLTKKSAKPLAGVLTSSGALGTIKTFVKAVAGAIEFAGSLATEFIQGLIKQAVGGAIEFAGTVAKKTKTTLSAALEFAGAILKKATFRQAVAGALSFLGEVDPLSILRKAVSGTIEFAGAVGKKTKTTLSAALDFIGSLVSKGAFKKALSGALSSSGTVIKTTTQQLAGALTSSGQAIKKSWESLAGSLSFAGSLVKPVRKVLAGSLSFAGVLASSIGAAALDYIWLRRRRK